MIARRGKDERSSQKAVFGLGLGRQKIGVAAILILLVFVAHDAARRFGTSPRSRVGFGDRPEYADSDCNSEHATDLSSDRRLGSPSGDARAMVDRDSLPSVRLLTKDPVINPNTVAKADAELQRVRLSKSWTFENRPSQASLQVQSHTMERFGNQRSVEVRAW